MSSGKITGEKKNSEFNFFARQSSYLFIRRGEISKQYWNYGAFDFVASTYRLWFYV